MQQTLPSEGFATLKQIIGDKEKGLPGVIPVSRTTWWRGVKSGAYPKPVNTGGSCLGWRVEDIRSLITEINAGTFKGIKQ